MRRIFVKYETGYCGMDAYDVIEFRDEDLEDFIDEDLFWRAVEHAASYGVELCPFGEDCEDLDCEYEHLGSTNICASWEDYVPEKHDQHRSGGGSFLEDFKNV